MTCIRCSVGNMLSVIFRYFQQTKTFSLSILLCTVTMSCSFMTVCLYTTESDRHNYINIQSCFVIYHLYSSCFFLLSISRFCTFFFVYASCAHRIFALISTKKKRREKSHSLFSKFNNKQQIIHNVLSMHRNVDMYTTQWQKLYDASTESCFSHLLLVSLLLVLLRFVNLP